MDKSQDMKIYKVTIGDGRTTEELVTAAQQRGLAREVFQEVRLREGRLVAVRPRPKYAPLFAYAIWRQHVAGGTRSS